MTRRTFTKGETFYVFRFVGSKSRKINFFKEFISFYFIIIFDHTLTTYYRFKVQIKDGNLKDKADVESEGKTLT